MKPRKFQIKLAHLEPGSNLVEQCQGSSYSQAQYKRVHNLTRNKTKIKTHTVHKNMKISFK